jgi:hypothetical protein
MISTATASQSSTVDLRSALAIREYSRICTSESIDPTNANGHTGMSAFAYSLPPMTATIVGPIVAAPSTTTASSAAQIPSARGTILRLPSSLASLGSTRMATAWGNQ